MAPLADGLGCKPRQSHLRRSGIFWCDHSETLADWSWRVTEVREHVGLQHGFQRVASQVVPRAGAQTVHYDQETITPRGALG
jgi:hypothetical protein